MLRTEFDDGVVTITLDRPERLNALSWEMMDRLAEAVAQLGGREDVRALVLTGVGRAFCGGADLKSLDPERADLPESVFRNMVASIAPLCEALLAVPVPVVAAVNGPCIGGGVGLAVLADVVLAGRSAYFLLPQVTGLGIVPDIGVTATLPHRIGRARTLAMSVTGERIPAEQAERWGLVWRCVEDDQLLAEAGATARRLATRGESVVATRQLVDATAGVSLAEQLHQEALAQRRLFEGPAARVRIKQFHR